MSGAGQGPAGVTVADRRLASAGRMALVAASTGCLIALVTVVLCWSSARLHVLLLVTAWNVLPFALLWLVLARLLKRPAGWLAGAAGFAAMAAAQAYVLYGTVVQILLSLDIPVAGALAEPLFPLTLLYSPLHVGAMGLAALAVAVTIDRARGRAGA